MVYKDYNMLNLLLFSFQVFIYPPSGFGVFIPCYDCPLQLLFILYGVVLVYFHLVTVIMFQVGTPMQLTPL